MSSVPRQAPAASARTWHANVRKDQIYRAGGVQTGSGIVRVLRLSDVEPGVSQFLSNHHADQRITLDDQYLCRYRIGLGLGSMEFPS